MSVHRCLDGQSAVQALVERRVRVGKRIKSVTVRESVSLAPNLPRDPWPQTSSVSLCGSRLEQVGGETGLRLLLHLSTVTHMDYRNKDRIDPISCY